MSIRIHSLFLLLLIPFVFPVRAEWVQEGQNKMGTRVFIKLWSEDASSARGLLGDAMVEFDRIETAMSTYRADSEISRVNENAYVDWVFIDREMFDLIRRSLELSVMTNGSFDITYDSIGQFYDFRRHLHPSGRQVEERLPSVGYRHIRLDSTNSGIRFTHPKVRINLGGIAKGYAVESVVRLLERAGVHHALVNAGGDTRVLGDRVGQPWTVGVRDPDDELKFVARLALDDEAISTSGDYEQYFMEEGIRYHHILDPSTGTPATGVRSVTVTGPDATMTDGLSTSVFIMGPEVGLQLIETLRDYEGIVIDQDRNVHYSTGIKPL